MQIHWRDSLEDLTSLGAAHEGVTRLADLARARNEHLGQFFTPLPVVRMMWAIVDQASKNYTGAKIAVLDNSVGSGRLLHYAQPDKHTLYGVDVHKPVVQALQAAGEAAGFTCEFAHAPMEQINPKGFAIALLNPPFSLNLQSPHMKPLACTRWGRFGPNTGATSDEYALAQALHAAKVVIAVLPTTMTDELTTRGAEIVGETTMSRLTAIFDLGTKPFQQEGANVAVSLVVFSASHRSGWVRERVDNLANWQPPALGVELPEDTGDLPKLRLAIGDTQEPAIHLPVTGERRVRLVHSGRKIHLVFGCGFMQAKCLNAVYRKRVYSTLDHRLPAGVRYAGQGVLDVENLVAAADFDGAWTGLLDDLKREGAEVEVDASLLGHLRRRRNEAVRQRTPLGRWIWTEANGDNVEATAKVAVALDPSSWTSPMVRAGHKATLQRRADNWVLAKGDLSRMFTSDEAKKLFDLPTVDQGWREITPPLQRLFPQVAASFKARALSLGLDRFLNWTYQFEDLIEVCMRPGGCVVGWKQGLGKARLAAAIPLLLNTRHALVAMPAFLLDEFPDRLKAAGIGDDTWQVIKGQGEVQHLRRINVISYERLRMQMAGTRRTYAAALRRRCSVVICDEGEILCNPDSEQSRAVAHLAAKRLFVLTGTPQANYPRDLLQVGVASVGDGVAGQPYGVRHPVVSEVNVKSMEYAQRGVAKFADDFVSFEWVTNEFAETLREGAKREVPRINNLALYRNWIAPFIKRRLPKEPQVAEFVKIKDAIVNTLELEWDREHLAHYLRVADEFAGWWLDRRDQKQGQNLVALLVRIGAVEAAGNAPQLGSGDGPSLYRGGLTSKQRWVINRAVEVSKTKKVVVYAKSPMLLELYSQELRKCHVESVLYHGDITRKNRRQDLERFRYGDINVLLASFGVTRAGLDLYQASHVIFGSRLWSETQEDQAVYRLLRPQQTEQVVVEKPHIRGGIDIYQDQLVTWKAAAANAGLDWGSPMGDDIEFLHLDQVLGSFVADLAKLHGMTEHDFRTMTKEVA